MTALKSMTLLLAALLVFTMSGCTASQGPSDGLAVGAEREPATQRFRNRPLEGRTAVESAIELSEKYAQLSDQTATLREENQRLAAENENLQQQVTSLEARLKQTQKELGEANDLLIKMLGELNNWKSNILGFRSEMRNAATAQLEALLKILEILGGEAEAGVLERRHNSTLDPGTNDVAVSNEPSLKSDANEVP